MLRRTGLGLLLFVLVGCGTAPSSRTTASTGGTTASTHGTSTPGPTLAVPPTDEPTAAPTEVAVQYEATVLAVPDVPETATVALTAMVAKTANVRDKPTATGSTVLGQVEGGTLVKLRMRNAGTSWYVVEAPSGIIGWMSATLLSVDSAVAGQVAEGTDDPAIAEAPAAPAPTEAPAPTDEPAADVAAPAPTEAPAAAAPAPASGRAAPQGSSCPDDQPIKGNIRKKDGRHLYHMPGEGSYNQTKPEACFATRAAAEAAGYVYSRR